MVKLSIAVIYIDASGLLAPENKLPAPYSPDFNPIELLFAKLKALLRTARCRSREAIWEFLGTCLSRFASTECDGYLRHCGYGVTTRS